jgi:flagellar hook-associated protein 2
MAVDYLSAINRQGSGLNITQIVDSLVEAETAPVEATIQRKIDEKNAAISGYAIIANELDKIKSYSNANKGATAYSVSSDSSSIGVTVSDQSLASAFNSSISVSSLASAQTIEFSGFSSKTATINKGTVNVEFGEWNGNAFTANSSKSSQSVEVTSANNTLSGLASSLSAISGVNATVTDKGDGTFSLIINSDTGSKNALRFSINEDGADPGLSSFDTTSNNASVQVVRANDASININGVTVTRETNSVSDLIDGYEFKLNAVTTSAATVVSSLDSNLAFTRVQEFVEVYNNVQTTIDTLTQRGLDGAEAGVLARDVGITGIKNKLRSLVSSEMSGYGANGRYISELGIKTERDGSLSVSEADFKKKFEAEPILFDVMMNSLGTSDNPLVKVSHDSTVLQPKGGTYNFIAGSDGESSTLGGIALSEDTLSDGTKKYAGISGDISGLKLEVSGTVSSATVYYGQSFLSKLSDYIEEVVSSSGVLTKSKSQARTSISDFNEDKAKLDERVTSLRERYMAQFSAMEAAVTGFKKTGEFLTGFIDALNPKD